MGDVISNLKAKFTVESKDVPKGLKPGQDALLDFDRKVGQTIGGLGKMFAPLALLSAAGGAFAGLKKAIDSIEGPGDRLESTMGGVSEALFEAGRAIATMDFKGFFDNLDEGFERGVAFTEMLDELADKSAYNDYRINQLKRESAQLQEIVKNKTLELSVRTEAAEKVKDLEQQVRDRRLQLAKEEFEILRDQWSERNNMEAEAALKLYETIDNMSPELKKRLQKVFTDAKEGALGIKAADYAAGIVTKGLYSAASHIGGDATLYQEVPQEVLDSYAEYFRLLETGEREVLIKLFNTYKNIEETGYKAQEDYNTTVAQTTRLLAQEEKQAKATGDSLKYITDELKAQIDVTAIAPVDTSHLTSYINLAPLEQAKDDVAVISADMANSMKSMENAIESALINVSAAFGNWVGEMIAGTADSDDLLLALGNLFGDMLIQLGEIAIMTGVATRSIYKALESGSWQQALIAGVALVALGSAVKSGMASLAGSTGGGGSSSGSSSGTFDSRSYTPIYANQGNDLNKEIQFRIQGPDLVAVLEKETTRKGFTT
jgi:hypothetical protein